MNRYVAFLRGVSPQNARMPDLKKCFESAGFTDVRTVLTSGNVIFNSEQSSIDLLQRQIEKTMESNLGWSFSTIVRSVQHIRQILDADPFSKFCIPDNAKKVITFLREPIANEPKLPIVHDGVMILCSSDHEVFTAYVPHPKGPLFMTMLEKTLGTNITTRTLDTVRKCISA